MKKKPAIGSLCVFVAIFAMWWSIKLLWPTYDFRLALPSPNGLYVAVVIRGNKAGFDDFFYEVRLFPASKFQENWVRGQRIWMAGVWSDSDYLIYRGYATPGLHWIDGQRLAIDLEDLQNEVEEFRPRPAFELDPKTSVSAELLFKTQEQRGVLP